MTMAEDSGATGSAHPPNDTPDESDVDLGISKRDHTVQLSSSLRKLGSDLPTGKPLGPRDQFALIRSNSSVSAMRTGARRRGQFKRVLKKVAWHHYEDEADSSPSPKRGMKWRNQMDIEPSVATRTMHGRLSVQATKIKDDDVELGKGNGTQYSLTAQSPKNGMVTCILGMLGFSAGGNGIYEDPSGGDNGCKCCGVSPDLLVAKYLHWIFRASFFTVMSSAALGFFVLTLLFAALILWSGKNRPECIHVNGVSFGNSTNQFADAYQLSWTTFSTCGYGLIFPSTGAIVEGGTRCIGISILCALDSFVGILFGSFCGAILFGKVSRIRSHAQVIFSDPLVVRYGTGVGEQVDDDESSSGGTDNEKKWDLPCPVLEFRVINRLHSTNGGELMDATLNVVACIKEDQACETVRNASKYRKSKWRRRTRRHNAVARHPSIPEQRSFHSGNPEESIDHMKNGETLTYPSATNRKFQSFEEDSSCKLVPRRIFTKLELDTPDHPFFKRTWHVSHILDADSPLLTSEARRKVHANHGFWPEELNNYEEVRANIHFDHIMVSLTGTSNAGANFVHAQKVYDYVDMNVGYRFANVLYRQMGDGSVRVDTTVMNDVLEQFGGGGEPLFCDQKKRRNSDFWFV